MDQKKSCRLRLPSIVSPGKSKDEFKGQKASWSIKKPNPARVEYAAFFPPTAEHPSPMRAARALSRSSFYYEPAGVSADDLRLMGLIDRQYTARPFYGSRRMVIWLGQQGEDVNRKRVRRLMRIMGLEAIYPQAPAEHAGQGHRIYPICCGA